MRRQLYLAATARGRPARRGASLREQVDPGTAGTKPASPSSVTSTDTPGSGRPPSCCADREPAHRQLVAAQLAVGRLPFGHDAASTFTALVHSTVG
jgi:hypothetical protein